MSDLRFKSYVLSIERHDNHKENNSSFYKSEVRENNRWRSCYRSMPYFIIANGWHIYKRLLSYISPFKLLICLSFDKFIELSVICIYIIGVSCITDTIKKDWLTYLKHSYYMDIQSIVYEFTNYLFVFTHFKIMIK